MEIKPCPRCGGEAYERSEAMCGDTSIPYIIRCCKCGYSISTAISPYSPNADKEHKEFYARWERGE